MSQARQSQCVQARLAAASRHQVVSRQPAQVRPQLPHPGSQRWVPCGARVVAHPWCSAHVGAAHLLCRRCGCVQHRLRRRLGTASTQEPGAVAACDLPTPASKQPRMFSTRPKMVPRQRRARLPATRPPSGALAAPPPEQARAEEVVEEGVGQQAQQAGGGALRAAQAARGAESGRRHALSAPQMW